MPSVPEKAVKLLISDTQGTMSLIGMTTPLTVKQVFRTPKGACTPGNPNLLFGTGDYEPAGEVRLLGPIPVNKSLGNANECPCFTTADTNGGPSAPSDNSAVGGDNPCTLRVRRLQLKECHR